MAEINRTFSAGDKPIFRGTQTGEDYQDATITVDNSGLAGPPDDTVVSGKVLGDEFHVPVDGLLIPDTAIKTADTGGVTAGNTYNMTPVLAECLNGDVLCFYSTGTTHRSLTDNVVYKRLPKGADYQTGWGPEVSVAENVTYGARFSAGGVGVHPVTGRVMVFYVLMGQQVDDFELYEYHYIYSDDHGVTWSTPVDLYPQFQAAGLTKYPSRYPVGNPDTNPDPRPFGRIEMTAAGLMTLVYVPRNNVVAVLSPDDGDTWDIAGGIVVDNFAGTYELSEPNLVKVDDNSVVIICRDDADDWKASYSKGTYDGNDWTFTAFSAPTEFFDYIGTAPSGAASCQGARIGNRVYGFFTAREPVGFYYQTCVSVTEFWADPASLWDPNKAPQLRASQAITPGNEAYLDAGYGSIIPIEHHDYTALCAYYAPTSTTDETRIMIRSMFRV